ncbi:N-acetylglucosamine-6-phosphate deacetylase [Oceaniglobus roseus]|uniref:N-acetylglucosamine-6-phosphate deacetylase n=1 Tax=Oceaniglobus roseus TaxID=1737570 RepID=UPI000C7EF193|nr:N-acetylglucosamine-6-phosphate deacetylase [Kandeliimicrobium roseum]
MSGRVAYTGARIHDGAAFRPEGTAALVEDGRLAALLPGADLPPDARRITPPGGVLCPGFVDLQVNGGGGVMFNDAPEPATLATIAAAHHASGTAALLPTLITDTPDTTRRAIDAAAEAIAGGMDGIAGLHLEGPHLDPARAGAHDPALIRPMTAEDLALLCDAARRLPALLLTVAPGAVSPAQIAELAQAGATVFLGHSDAPFDLCAEAVAAGARGVTHLFNAMSQLGGRTPGLVGAALNLPGLAAGLIADGVHVHPAAIRTAMAACPEGLFLVTDAMATVGAEIDGFTLNGRRILKAGDRLTLADGTLAGAHLTLPRAVGVMVEQCGAELSTAIAMATGRPAAVMGLGDGLGFLDPGTPFRAAHLDTHRWSAAPPES